MNDENSIYDAVTIALDPTLTLTSGMHALTDVCRRRRPSGVWDSVDSIDFANDAIALRRWCEELLRTDPPGRDIQAFWFGLYNPADEAGNESAGLYLCGSPRYNPNDFDWAVWSEDTYLPEERYAPSTALAELFETVQTGADDIPSIGEYVLCLGYGLLVVREICSTIDPSLFLGKASVRHVAVGFDDGDAFTIGKMDPSGWCAAAEDW